MQYWKDMVIIMEQGRESLFKQPSQEEPKRESLFKQPSLFQKPKLQPNDPRNGLSKSQIAEAEANKKEYHKADDALATVLPVSWSDVVAFGKGFTHNMDEYGASINKGLGKLSKAILPKEYQTSFFEDNAKYWDDKRKQNEIETEDNKIAHIAGELIADPMNLSGTGLVSKGSKLARVGKSMVAGAGVGFATSKAKNYGNTSITDEQKSHEDVMSTGIVSVLNGVIAGLTKGKVTNAIKDVEHMVGDGKSDADGAIDILINDPERAGFSKAQADKIVSDYKEVTKPQPELIREKSNANVNTPNDGVDNIFEHPRAKEAIDLARDRYASQTYNDRVGVGSASWMNPDGTYARAGAKGETNYHQGFELSKADVKKIDSGKITPEIEEKLRLDIDRLENDPNWNTKEVPMQDTYIDENGDLIDSETGNAIFANAGHNLAGGFGAGTVNAGSGLFDGSYDPNKDLSSQMADRFIQGMVAGTLGVTGLKMLRRTNPEAFKKVQSWVMDNEVKVGDKMPTEGVQLGVFAGKKAKGFEGKTTHAGKYDGQERFEIDDSKMDIKKDGVIDLTQKGHTTLENLIKHDELFDNYPQLRDVVVKFDKNMEAHASFDGDSTITISNKFKNKDELGSSIIHEIQHWVQNKEGFAGGGNFDDMLLKVNGKIDGLERQGNLSQLDAVRYKDDLDFLKNNKTKEAYEGYKKIAGEIEAREVQARKNLTPEERDVIPHYENTSTMGAEHGDEAYNSAFMAELDGRLGDFDSTGIHPDDATLDFSRNKMESRVPEEKVKIDKGVEHLERILNKHDAKEFMDLSQGLKSSLKASFLDSFSGEYHKIRANATAGKHKMARQAERMGRILGKLPEQMRKDLQEYIVGDVHPSSVSEQVRQIGNNIRQTIKDMQDEMKKLDVFDEKDIDAWGDNYLRRLYKKHFAEDEINLAKGLLGDKTTLPIMKARGKSETISQKEYDRRVASGELDESLIGKPKKDGGIEKSVIAGKVTLERDWTKAERIEMGEIVDASITVPETFMKMAQMVEHGRMLQEVAKLEGAIVTKGEAKLATKEALHAEGFVKLDNMPQFGALSGQWVRKDIADDIGALADSIMQRQGDITAEAKALWMKYLSRVKKALTVWNLPTHVNNAFANPFLMHASGMKGKEVAGGIIKSIIQMNKAPRLTELMDKEIIGTLSTAERAELSNLKKDMKYYMEAEEQGLLNTSRLEDIKIGEGDAPSVGKKSVLERTDDYLTKKYQDGDGMSKLAMFTHLREAGWDVVKAREGALAIMPDYSKPMAPAWRTLRDSGITPFISWTYYTLPKMLRLASSARGSASIATAIGSTYILSGMLTGITDPYSDELPDDAHMARVPIWKDGDNITTIKMDRINPFMQLLHPLQMAQETATNGLPQTLVSLISGTKLYNGRPITYENKPKAQQYYDRLKYASSLTPLPGQVRSGIELIESLVRDDKNRKISKDVVPRSLIQEIVRQAGVNSLTFNSRQVKKHRKQKESKQKWF
jgi:hypothetical protein